ncbi:MAG TPA: nuclear transport factor 2 family protein [Anaeromyxobacteraceae bacterium]|jgi:ketosteroid isomerase-like protein
MRRAPSLAAASLAAALGACAGAPTRPLDPGAAAAAARAADAAFSASVVSRDERAFLALVAEDAVFAGGRRLQTGRDEVRAAWAVYFGKDAPDFRWAPDGGGAAGSGDLAWTTGRWRMERKDASGTPAAAEGRYLSVWRRAGEAWQVALDCGYRPADELGPLERRPLRTLTSADGSLEAALGSWTRAAGGPRRGAYLTVRERAGGAWRTLHDAAAGFAEPTPPP